MKAWKSQIVSSLKNRRSQANETLVAKHDYLVTLLRKHKQAEVTLGAEIHPAARKQSFTEEGREDDKRKIFPSFELAIVNRISAVCRELEEDLSRRVSLCTANANGLLDW
jgi:hypothetical protein